MIEKVKSYCNHEIENVEKRGYDPHGAVTRCYGAIMFVANEILGGIEGEELGKWWDNEMLPKFRELERR